MKKMYGYLLCFAGIQLLNVVSAHAQETTLALKSPATAVTIDGNNKEWDDSLAYYNTENKLNYAIANDKQNLYLVIKTNDLAKQNYILSSGVTLGIDTKGRNKKAVFAVTFPKSGQENMKRGAPSLEENKLRAGVLNFRKIGVKGFDDIAEDEITFSNAIGIQIAIGFDNKGYMTYEEAIPLDLFHAGDLAKNDWTFNIKLNPPAKSEDNSMKSEISTAGLPGFASGGSRSGSASRGGRVPVNTFAGAQGVNAADQKPIDFWGKFKLAQ